MTPGAAHAAHFQFAMNVRLRMVNSPTKPLRSGSPIEERNMIMVIVA